MAYKTRIHNYISKYLIGVRNCINTFMFYGLEVLH